MKKLAKRYAESVKLVEKDKEYEIKEALDLVEKMPKAKFDETVELHVKLGVDSKHADQQVRGTVVLPNGTGKTQKVLVFAKGPKAEEAEKAGADFVGAEELIPKIQNENWFDYDVVVATPDMMGVVGRLGKVLGPKGLMPNPKSGTVTMDVTKAINEIKSGKVEYRLDKTNIIHLGFGKVSSFIVENPKLEIYKLSLHNLFRLQEHIQLDEINQKIKENSDSINEQLSIYNNLLRDIKYESINVDGEEVKITSSNFAKYISSRDRETRKQTYFVVNNAFQKEKDNFANILNRIYGFRIENSILEKYNSVLEKILFEENINPEIINKLIESVNNNLGLIQEYLKIKSDLLEIEEPHLYDFGVPLNSNLKIKYSLEEGKEIILKALEPLGQEYIEIVKTLFDGHIDAELNENKHQSIIFSWHTYSFMNFKGSYIDLKNMIHEIGHIVNYYLSTKEQPFIYEDSTIFVGETASITNEILLNRYLYNNANTQEEKIFYLSKEIENYFTSVFKQTMYTEFENDLYKIKMKSELTSEVLCERYARIIRNILVL